MNRYGLKSLLFEDKDFDLLSAMTWSAPLGVLVVAPPPLTCKTVFFASYDQ
jgi:hypothetical protein